MSSNLITHFLKIYSIIKTGLGDIFKSIYHVMYPQNFEIANLRFVKIENNKISYIDTKNKQYYLSVSTLLNNEQSYILIRNFSENLFCKIDQDFFITTNSFKEIYNSKTFLNKKVIFIKEYTEILDSFGLSTYHVYTFNKHFYIFDGIFQHTVEELIEQLDLSKGSFIQFIIECNNEHIGLFTTSSSFEPIKQISTVNIINKSYELLLSLYYKYGMTKIVKIIIKIKI